MTQDDKRLVRRRESRPQKTAPRWKAYRFEIAALAAIVTGAALIGGHGVIRARIAGWFSNTIGILGAGFGQANGALNRLVARITVSDVIGFVLIGSALAFLLVRLRRRLLLDPILTRVACPRCGSSLHRVHRRWFDRLINRYVPVRRYRCGNAECRWRGLRVGRGGPGRARRPAAVSQP